MKSKRSIDYSTQARVASLSVGYQGDIWLLRWFLHARVFTRAREVTSKSHHKRDLLQEIAHSGQVTTNGLLAEDGLSCSDDISPLQVCKVITFYCFCTIWSLYLRTGGAYRTEHAAIERRNCNLIFFPREGKPHAKLNDCFVWLKIFSISNSFIE